jgi:hypothetical protein
VFDVRLVSFKVSSDKTKPVVLHYVDVGSLCIDLFLM